MCRRKHSTEGCCGASIAFIWIGPPTTPWHHDCNTRACSCLLNLPHPQPSIPLQILYQNSMSQAYAGSPAARAAKHGTAGQPWPSSANTGAAPRAGNYFRELLQLEPETVLSDMLETVIDGAPWTRVAQVPASLAPGEAPTPLPDLMQNPDKSHASMLSNTGKLSRSATVQDLEGLDPLARPSVSSQAQRPSQLLLLQQAPGQPGAPRTSRHRGSRLQDGIAASWGGAAAAAAAAPVSNDGDLPEPMGGDRRSAASGAFQQAKASRLQSLQGTEQMTMPQSAMSFTAGCGPAPVVPRHRARVARRASSSWLAQALDGGGGGGSAVQTMHSGQMNSGMSGEPMSRQASMAQVSCGLGALPSSPSNPGLAMMVLGNGSNAPSSTLIEGRMTEQESSEQLSHQQQQEQQQRGQAGQQQQQQQAGAAQGQASRSDRDRGPPVGGRYRRLRSTAEHREVSSSDSSDDDTGSHGIVAPSASTRQPIRRSMSLNPSMLQSEWRCATQRSAWALRWLSWACAVHAARVHVGLRLMLWGASPLPGPRVASGKKTGAVYHRMTIMLTNVLARALQAVRSKA